MQHLQQRRLGFEGQIADLVQKEGASLGHLEAAQLTGHGPGKGPPLVPEQFAFDQAGRNGATVHLDERPSPPAQGMDGPRRQALAGAGLTGNQHPHLPAGQGLHLLQDAAHGQSLADKLLNPGPLAQGAGQGLDTVGLQVGGHRQGQARRH